MILLPNAIFMFSIRFDGQNYAFGTCVSPDVNRIVEHIYERPTLDVGQSECDECGGVDVGQSERR